MNLIREGFKKKCNFPIGSRPPLQLEKKKIGKFQLVVFLKPSLIERKGPII
jgi:hypothetical protein